MEIITFDVETESFEEELYKTKDKFLSMVNTMKSIAVLIEMNTMKYVPEDTTALVQSFDKEILPTSDYILMMVGYDEVDRDSGFHYAEYQHETTGLHHQKPTAIDHYLVQGITDSRGEMFQMIEQDYLSLFTGGTVTSSTMGSITGDKIRLIRRII